MLDQEILLLQSAYFAGYYSRVKKPKSLKTIVNKVIKAHQKPGVRAAAPDVEKFERLERLFTEEGQVSTRG